MVDYCTIFTQTWINCLTFSSVFVVSWELNTPSASPINDIIIFIQDTGVDLGTGPFSLPSDGENVCHYLFQLFCLAVTFLKMSGFVPGRPVARGWGCTPKSAKRSTFRHKMGQKWGFWRRVKGWGSKSPLFGSKRSTFLGVPHLPKIDPGYGPGPWDAN